MTTRSRWTMPGSKRIAEAMSVRGPRNATNNGSWAVASLLSAMISCAPALSIGVCSSAIAAHFGTSRSNRSMKDSREEIDLLLDLLGVEHHVTVANGAPADLELRVKVTE